MRCERGGDEQALRGFSVWPDGSRAVSVLYSSHGGPESGRARRRRGKLWRGDGPPQTAVESNNDATGEEELTIGEKQRRQVAQHRQADAKEEGADKGSEQEQVTQVVARITTASAGVRATVAGAIPARRTVCAGFFVYRPTGMAIEAPRS
ncbi:hypothetical protein [Accumulibacter sp.]|uniref:hypothetical protein n=1 Tax=Accumulibacter sp. TaxID=2053492 RepID=UPI001D9E2065|nr:hypothetical protein [Accumulibacter sp.]MCB1942076.1 hypothetical protein [Accumulibacter sp.]MCP5230449.1 hypothetical protein [Accumulibacter sp.]